MFTVGNVGDGKVYGFEFDLSTPLTAFGLPNTGVFLNYSWLDSKVTDFMGERRFNDQATQRLQHRLHPGPAVRGRQLRRHATASRATPSAASWPRK